jgi:hypothetical protein
VLGDDLPALPVAPARLAPFTERTEGTPQAGADELDCGPEHPSERDLRREDHCQRQQREQDDRRAGAIEVVRRHARHEIARGPARMERSTRHVHAAERQAEEAAQAREEDGRPDDLRVEGVHGGAPEVVPAERQQGGWDQVRRVADQLERGLGDERADQAGKVGRLVDGAAREEPRGIGRIPGDKGHDPEQGGREERDADELAGATGKGAGQRVKSP